MKLQKKFILSMGLSALLPVLVISFLTYFTIKDYIIEIEGQRLKNVSLTALNTIEDQISSKINEVAVFAAIDTIVSSLDYEIYEQAHDLMASFVQNYQGYHEVRLVDLSGIVVSSSDQSHIGERHPAGAEANTVSMPYFNSKDKKFLINISIPVYMGSKRLGMLVAAYDIADVYGKVDWIEVSRSGDKKLGHVMVFDKTGRVFYTPLFERESVENILGENMDEKGLSSVKESLAGKSGYVIERAEHGFRAIIGYGSSERLLQLKAIALVDLNSVLSQINTLMVKILVFAIVFTLLGGTIAVLISRGFIRPLEQVVQRLDDIAEGEGDLTVRLDVSTSDEVGDLATGFNSFAEKIRDLVTRIAKTSGDIKDASGRNVTIGEQLSIGANEQATKITSASAAVNEMSSTIINIAQNASTAADAAKEVSDKVDEGNQVVELTAEGMRKIAEQVRSTAEGMNLLGNKVNEISTIVSVIDEIADQTNLLALNAAIEAARAGEQGRGFAVVADEVRKLAERTTRSTSEIVQMITSIQQESEKSVSGMDMVVNEVDSGLSLVEKSRQALDIIVTASKKGLDMASMIATASEQQSASTEDISLSLEAVNTVSVETASLAKQMEESSEGLLKLAGELDGIVGSFKTSSE